MSTTKMRKTHMMKKMRSNFSIRSYAPLALGLLALVFLLGYSLLQAYPFLAGPTLSVEAIQKENGLTTISGQAKRVSGVWINDLPVPTTEDGQFTVERAYTEGYTVVTVRALDRFGREREKTLTFVTNNHYASQEKRNEKNNKEDGVEGSEERDQGGETVGNS